jgi:hypothetical protein
VKHCASCGREVPESATVCEPCERWAAEQLPKSATPVAPPSSQWQEAAPAAIPAVPAAVPVPAKRPRGLVLVVALVAVGMVAFALLTRRGVPATSVAAAQPAPAVAARRASAPAASKNAAVRTQAWSSERRAYWTGSQRHSAAFELAAENSVPIWMNQVRPLLIVRCLSKKTEAFVFTGSALKIEPQTDDHTVNFRFDDETGTTVRWPDSAEHDALFSPDAVAFTQRLMQAHTLRFGYTPHNAAPVEAVFQVDGLAELIAPVVKDCGWKK